MKPRRRVVAAVLVGGVLWAVGFIGGRAAQVAAPELGWEPPKRLTSALDVVRGTELDALPTMTGEGDGSPGPHALPPTMLHPRDPDEWQGMQVDLSQQAVCEEGSMCGQAMACIEGKCGPCERDGQCAIDEACVLDHCVPKAHVACRSRRDCAGAGGLCILSGLSPGVRGNETMRALCSSGQGGDPEVLAEAPTAEAPVGQAVSEPMAVPLKSLVETARAQ